MIDYLNSSLSHVPGLSIVSIESILGNSIGVEAFIKVIYQGENPEVGDPDPADQSGLKINPEDACLSVIRGVLSKVGINRKDQLTRVGLVLSQETGPFPNPIDVKDLAVRSGISVIDELRPPVNSLTQSIDQVNQRLQDPDIDLVILIAVNSSDVIAFLLTQFFQARSNNWKIYSHIRGACQGLDSVSRIFKQTDLLPDEVGLFEVHGIAEHGDWQSRLLGKLDEFHQVKMPLSCAMDCSFSPEGKLTIFDQFKALLKTSLCVSEHIIPEIHGWEGFRKPEHWADLPFYIVDGSRTWFLDENKPGRLAALYMLSGANQDEIVLVEGVEHPGRRVQFSMRPSDYVLLPVPGNSQSELQDQLVALLTRTAGEFDPASMGEEYLRLDQDHQSNYCLVLAGRNSTEIHREVEYAIKNLPICFEKNSEWQTPSGSYFSPDPQGKVGKVAFVYPGAFNSYIGAGRDLFYLFHGLYELAVGIRDNLSEVIHEKQLYPRSLVKLSKEQIKTLEGQLIADPVAMLATGTALSILYSAVVRDIFGIRPDAAFGYSLGENSMLFSMRIWDSEEEVRQILLESPLFRTRLAGPQNAVREYWDLPIIDDWKGGNPIWGNYLLMAGPEKVLEQIAGEDKVYLTHINTPNQVVIAGDPAACERVIHKVHCNSMKMPFDYALHCDPVVSEYSDLVDLNRWPIKTHPEVSLYTSSTAQSVQLEEQLVAENIARTLCTCVDFPRLIRQVYEDGSRIFIEMGAGSNCSRWVDETLKGNPHISISMDRNGQEDSVTIMRSLARLLSHRVPMNLTPLFSTSELVSNVDHSLYMDLHLKTNVSVRR